jgi:dephospho-CoA kinase
MKEVVGMKQNKFKVIGITGGIASGKSTITNHLISRNYKIIDADKIARDVVAIGTIGIYKIESIFGEKVINKDKSLNRKALRNIVFNNNDELKKLNAITHPLILSEIKKQINYYKHQDSINIIFLDCPLLFEMGLDNLTDEVWLVSTNVQNQVSRLMKRDSITNIEATNIISFQMPLDEKIEKADIIIENNETKNKLINTINIILNGGINV